MIEVPTTFSFVFPDEGIVHERDMTREQLLHVIRYLMTENDRWMGEARKPKYWWQQAKPKGDSNG